MKYKLTLLYLILSCFLGSINSIQAQVLDKKKLLEFAEWAQNKTKVKKQHVLPVIYETANLEAASAVNSDAVWAGNESGLALSGDSITIGYWDQNKPLLTHQEYNGRVSFLDSEAGSKNNHATNMVGTIIATGINPNARGMANEASVSAWNWNNDISEMATEASSGLLTSAHPYIETAGWTTNANICGPGWMWFSLESSDNTKAFQFGYYDNQAQYWDSVAYLAPDYLILKAAGNQRGEGPVNQPITHWKYDSSFNCVQDSVSVREVDGGVDGYESINAASLAKNVLVVGAVESNTNDFDDLDSIEPTSTSGFGPTDEGRIKPDIVAPTHVFTTTSSSNNSYGTGGGTSAATAVVAGSVALIREHYQDLNSDTLSSASLRALLAHTSDDIGNPGPDYKTGWGMLNTERAIRFISANSTDALSNQLIDTVLMNEQSLSFTFNHQNSRPLVLTVAWTDPAATPSIIGNDPSDLKLVNDLDITVEDSEGAIFLPWVLDHSNPDFEATFGNNEVDNIEQIKIENPQKGNFNITLTHKGLLTNGSQRFTLLMSESEPELEFETASTGDWSSGSVWENGVAPTTTYHRAVIKHSIELDQDVNIHSVAFGINSGSLALNGNKLTVSDGFKELSTQNGLIADSLAILSITGWSMDSDTLELVGENNQLKKLLIDALGDTIHVASTIKVYENLDVESGVINVESANVILMTDSSYTAGFSRQNGGIIGDLFYSRTFYEESAGWRLIATPFEDESLRTLSEFFHTQGGEWATFQVEDDESNLWVFDKVTQDYQAHSSTDTTFMPGLGYLFYMFEGGKPLVLSGMEPDSLSINLFRGTHDSLSYNLVGNPFASTIDWHQVVDESENLSTNYAVWNPASSTGGGTSGFSYYNAINGLGSAGRFIAPMQGFFVQAINEDAQLNFNQVQKTVEYPEVYGKKADHKPDHIQFTLQSQNGEILDNQAHLIFHDKAGAGADIHDVARLKSLNSIVSQVSFLDKNKNKRVFEGRSALADKDTVRVVIELGKSGRYLLRWDMNGEFNSDSQLFLHVEELGQPIDLKTLNFLEIEAPSSGSYFYDIIVARNSTTNTSIEVEHNFQLFQNYPNPFNPATTISYQVPQNARVSLEVFDINGRLVKTLINNEVQHAGVYSRRFNSNVLSSGVYFYRLSVGDQVETKKMLLIK
ncbi:MAG: S8 family peptidase [Balneolaceae bacterium]|nr:S8 family peptidase [Balneolaceae bacterium]